MHLKKLYGYVHSLLSFNFLCLVLFQFLATIKLHVPFPIHLPSLPVPSILTFDTILFVTLSKTALFQLHGYLLVICRRIFLRRRFLFPFSLVIATFLVFLFLHLCCSFSFLLSSYFLVLFRSDGGVLTIVIGSERSQNTISHHVASRSL